MTKLKDVREKKLLSREELAIKAKVSLRTIANAERGRGVTLTTFKKLVKILEVDTKKLI